MGAFPDCFPDDFASAILPKEAGYKAHFGYRIAKYGRECPVSYFSTVEERIIDGKALGQSRKADDYSTSLFDTPDYPRYILSLVMRYDRRPKACLVSGYTVPECGPSLVDVEKPHRTRNGPIRCRHISWWIYEEARPWEYFEEAGEKA